MKGEVESRCGRETVARLKKNETFLINLSNASTRVRCVHRLEDFCTGANDLTVDLLSAKLLRRKAT
jgi:hypothetical protein